MVVYLQDSESRFSLTLILWEELNSKSVFLPTYTITEYNSSGTFTLLNRNVTQYTGHVSKRPNVTSADGTLYKDSTFEGTIRIHNTTYYLEAMERIKPWNVSYSILYEHENIKSSSETDNFKFLDDDVVSFTNSPSPIHLSDGFLLHGSSWRTRREAESDLFSYDRFCSLHIVIDPFFTYYMANNNRHEAVNLIARVVKEINTVSITHIPKEAHSPRVLSQNIKDASIRCAGLVIL